jgi:hypothetical protein
VFNAMHLQDFDKRLFGSHFHQLRSYNSAIAGTMGRPEPDVVTMGVTVASTVTQYLARDRKLCGQWWLPTVGKRARPWV